MQSRIDIDREAGIIRGVSVIAAGMTKPSGGGREPFMVDATTLQQVADAINASAIGVKSRITHPELTNADDLPLRVGYVRNARVDGDRVRADFHAHSAADINVVRLMGIAENDPTSCGLSIVAATVIFDQLPNHSGTVLRIVDRIDAADWVGDPAANPTGMLSAHRESENTMSISLSDNRRAAFVRHVSDAILAKLGKPLALFDDDSRIVRNVDGTPRLREPDSDTLRLSSGRLVDIAGHFYAMLGFKAAREWSPGEMASFLCSRARQSAQFPAIPLGCAPQVALAASGDFPGLLVDTMNKATITGLAQARRTWRGWAQRGFLPDYKSSDFVRLEDASVLPKLLPGDTIDYGYLQEAAHEQVSLATYRAGARLTREAIINDDVRLLASIPQMFTQAAYRTEDSVAYAVLTTNTAMADGVQLFATGHSNTVSGALSVANFSTARGKIARQTAHDGTTPADLVAARLIVPPELEATAEQVLASTAMAERAGAEERVRLVVSPWLPDSAQWYVSTSPEVTPAVAVMNLSTEPDPVVESDTHFDSGGLKYKCRHSIAAKAIDYRAIVRGSGS